MARSIMLDEIHLRLLVPRGLPDSEMQAILIAITDLHFDADLRRAVRRLVRSRPTLCQLRFRIYR
jgi:hypothetical protein